MADSPNRYARQLTLSQIGKEGQARLGQSSVLLVGCGALGSTQATLLVRAGVGRLKLADRDFVQLDNLHRQTLYDEEDAAACLPKAEAAKRRLARVNHEVEVEAVVADVNARNVERLLEGIDLVLDGTDNAETRYLVNDACVKLGRPWVYGGAVGTSGVMLPVRPGAGPCLRCVFENPPSPGVLPTCDLVGVLNTAPALIAALQVTEAIRLLVGGATTETFLTASDVWTGSHQRLQVHRNGDCPCCAQRRFEFLDQGQTSSAVSLCGRHAVQITPPQPLALTLEALAERLAGLGEVHNNGLLVRFHTGDQELIVFPGGRAIVRGTSDPALARSLYARFVGN